MKNHLNLKLHQFLSDYSLKGSTVLVAVSGGVDSIVLFHELLKFKEKFSLNLVIVHVHHGWREESDEELSYIENLAKEKNVGFFAKKLHLSKTAKDAENLARSLRYEFFNSIYQSVGAHGIFLGHHAQDLEETVVKRLFEGAPMINIGGMSECSLRMGMRLFRPMLQLAKNELYELAKNADLKYFEDKTNFDSAFLRSRLRTEFFPVIHKIFNKNLEGNLQFISQQAYLMQDYFEKRLDLDFEVYRISDDKILLKTKPGLHKFEVLNLLLVFFKKHDISISRQMLNDLASTLIDSSNVKSFSKLGLNIRASKCFAEIECACFIKNELLLGVDQIDSSILPSWALKNTTV